jgi:hypothetical protein
LSSLSASAPAQPLCDDMVVMARLDEKSVLVRAPSPPGWMHMRPTHARLHHLGQGSMHATGYSPTHRTHRALTRRREDWRHSATWNSGSWRTPSTRTWAPCSSPSTRSNCCPCTPLTRWNGAPPGNVLRVCRTSGTNRGKLQGSHGRCKGPHATRCCHFHVSTRPC